MMHNFKERYSGVLRASMFSLLLLLSIGGCAHTGQVNDPFEPFNRKVQTFNDTVDRYTLKPVAQAYRYVLPEFLRKGIRHAFDNIAYPTVFLNQFLQGKGTTGLSDLARFLVNSTVGLGGVMDVATSMGLPAHDEDFGQTFAVWGIGSGPYMVVPFWGPVTARAGVGDVAGIFTYLPTYIDDDTLRFSIFGAAAVVERARLLDVEELITGDRYLFIRDAYLQRRHFLITDGLDEADPFLDD